MLALLLICTAFSPAYAAQSETENTPRLNTALHVTTGADLSSTGLLYVLNTYSTYDSQITRIVVTTYVEKRNLLLFWNRVDIGTTNNEWIDYGSTGEFHQSHSAQMPDSGTYRIIATFDVYNGSTLLDSIEKTIKKSY